MISWTLSGLTLLSIWMTGNKNKWGWVVGILNQIFWGIFIYQTKAWGLIPLSIALCAMYIVNFVKWHNE